MTVIEKMQLGAERLANYAQGYADGVDTVTAALTSHAAHAFEDASVEAQQKRPEWAEVAQFADITAERDRARETAVRLEQELAEKERELDETRQHMIKGVLLAVQREAINFSTSDAAAVQCATSDAAEKFGVEL
ncbi:hypothetical protein [Leucobacter sp.]